MGFHSTSIIVEILEKMSIGKSIVVLGSYIYSGESKVR